MHSGTVKTYNKARGLGFITDSASGQDIFFHMTQLIDEVRESDKVNFEVQEGPKGLHAINIKLA